MLTTSPGQDLLVVVKTRVAAPLNPMSEAATLKLNPNTLQQVASVTSPKTEQTKLVTLTKT